VLTAGLEPAWPTGPSRLRRRGLPVQSREQVARVRNARGRVGGVGDFTPGISAGVRHAVASARDAKIRLLTVDGSPHRGYLRSVIVTVTDAVRPVVVRRLLRIRTSLHGFGVRADPRSQPMSFGGAEPPDGVEPSRPHTRRTPSRKDGRHFVRAAHGSRTRTTRLEASHAAVTSRPRGAWCVVRAGTS
jgi:hypothetical protein